ncbi:MAG: SAM-dependent methyltransferase [Desulforhopalus sp.]
MKSIINDPGRDPLGTMMLDYFHGDHDACVEVVSPELEMTAMHGSTMFRNYPAMSGLEQRALSLCRGKILDIGAGSGCHSLYLQNTGNDVEALDISIGCIEVMKRRGVKKTLHNNVYSLEKRTYTTLLMLMNGLGVCGTLDGLNLFLQVAKDVMVKGAQIIADSCDLRHLGGEAVVSCRTKRYYGEVEFTMKYRNITSKPFNWLYVDFRTLQAIVVFNSLRCEKLKNGPNGTYLVRIF